MASAAQCLQPANMAAHVGLRVAADPLHFGTGGFQMGAGVIDTKTRSGLLPSIPQRAGRGTFLPRSRTDFATAVICNGVTFRSSFTTLSTDTKVAIAITNFRCRSGWSDDHGLPSAEAASRYHQSQLSRLHRTGVGNINRQGAVRQTLDSRDQVRWLSGPSPSQGCRHQGVHPAW